MYFNSKTWCKSTAMQLSFNLLYWQVLMMMSLSGVAFLIQDSMVFGLGRHGMKWLRI